MYESYYKMNSKAFPGQPNPAVFFESEIHAGAMSFLTSGIEEKEPFVLLLGQYGMGKTLLALRLTNFLEERDHPYINLPTPVISYANLLEHIFQKYEWTPVARDEESLQHQLFQYLGSYGAGDSTLVIVLDEIQEYDISTLLKMRMLSNYNLQGHYPFQFVFLGHPRFLQTLSSPRLQALAQRIRRRYHLEPFTLEETREYVYFRLIESGARGRPYFPDDALECIHRSSGGIPRVINNICDTCLLIGASHNLDVIAYDVVKEALASAKIEGVEESVSDAMSAFPAVAHQQSASTGASSTEPDRDDIEKAAATSKAEGSSEKASNARPDDQSDRLPFEDADDDEKNKAEPLLVSATGKRLLFGGFLVVVLLLLVLIGILLRDQLSGVSATTPEKEAMKDQERTRSVENTSVQDQAVTADQMNENSATTEDAEYNSVLTTVINRNESEEKDRSVKKSGTGEDKR